MAKVKIQGHASGTGVLTVTAPNTSTDRTITLPDATGTLLNSDGDGSNLTGVGVDGITSSADATAINIDSSENVHIINGGKYLRFAYNNSNSHSAFQGWKHLQFGNNGANSIIAGNTATGGSLKFIVNNTVEMSSDNANSHDGTVSLELRADGRATSQFTANAWINFRGTGTISITDSHNFSSITDHGTGDYTVTMASAMANSNYMWQGTCMGYTNWYPSIFQKNIANTTTAIRIGTSDAYSNGGWQDIPNIGVLVFGD